MQVAIPNIEQSDASQVLRWRSATWPDYEAARDAESVGENRDRIFFDRNWLLRFLIRLWQQI
jgi:hypothetical protein